MSIAIDGTAHNAVTPGTGTVYTVGPLTTANANDVICVVVSSSGAPVVSVLASTGLLFTRRAGVDVNNSFGASQDIEFWYAVAANPLVAVTITITLTSNPGFITMDAFGVSGADLTNIFNHDPTCPDVDNIDPAVINTTNTTYGGASMILGFFHEHTTANPLASGPPFVTLSGADHQLVMYAVLGPAANQIVDDNTPADADGIIADAIMANFQATTMASRVAGVHFGDDISVVAY